MDINKAWLSGTVVSEPILTKLRHKTPFATFTLQVDENFVDKRKQPQTRPNMITVECLGKTAVTAADKVHEGQRVQIDGYLRSDRRDGRDELRVRVYAVYSDTSHDQVRYQEGLKKAMDIMSKSRDLPQALETITKVLDKD
jgi:single-stranded DNA-binding protein